MTTWGLVKSRMTGTALEFYSAVSGDTLLTIDGSADTVAVGSGAQLITTGPRIGFNTLTDVDAQNNTLTAAQILAGLVVHTSVTAGGTVTADTGANIKAAIPDLNTVGRYIDVMYINDGDQTLTLATASGVAIGDTGQTIAADESALLRVICTGDGTYTIYSVGA